MKHAMIAGGIVRISDQTFHLRWEVEDEDRPVKHSVLSLAPEIGRTVMILGRSFGIAQKRAVVFSALAQDCIPASDSELGARHNEYVDLVRIPYPITRTGPHEAIYYPPRAALLLRRLADQQRDRNATEARRAEIRREIDRITVTASIRVPMQITELSDRAKAQ